MSMYGTFIVEYSADAESKGLYPFYLCASKCLRPNPRWVAIFRGEQDAAISFLESKDREWQQRTNVKGQFDLTESGILTPKPAVEQSAKPPLHAKGMLRLRFLIFKRDGYKCVLCGKRAEDGNSLELGHKIARARGGGMSPENLMTLCFECNRGMRTDPP